MHTFALLELDILLQLSIDPYQPFLLHDPFQLDTSNSALAIQLLCVVYYGFIFKKQLLQLCLQISDFLFSLH